MEWTLERVEADLLANKCDELTLAREIVVAAVNRVEELLGPDWITQQTYGGKGLAVGMPIIQTGIELEFIEDVPRASDLLEEIRRDTQNARTELTAIYLLRSRRPSTELELYPEVGSRKADFRIREKGDPWTTVEVTNPTNSKASQILHQRISKLATNLARLDHPFSIEILFTREPSDEELKVLSARLPEFCKMDGRQHAILANRLGYLFLNDLEVGRLLLSDVPELKDVPLIGMAILVGGPAGRPVRQVTLRVPFTDERAANILKDEAKQLPRDGIGLVMIDVSNAPGGLKSWVQLMRRRFGPKINTRVSAVSLFKRSMAPIGARYGFCAELKLVSNPHARRELPHWIQAALGGD